MYLLTPEQTPGQNLQDALDRLKRQVGALKIKIVPNVCMKISENIYAIFLKAYNISFLSNTSRHPRCKSAVL